MNGIVRKMKSNKGVTAGKKGNKVAEGRKATCT